MALSQIFFRMSKNKLDKFAEMRSFSNVFQNFDFQDPRLVTANDQEVEMKGKWGEEYFHNDHPICLELACGRGEYTVNLARKYPNINFIGIDIKGARMHKGAKLALEESLENVAFLRIRIEQIDAFFENGEVDRIWITFPDPFLKRSDSNKRLTSSQFLERYRRILSADAFIHLKTDSTPLYAFTKEVVAQTDWLQLQVDDEDIYKGELPIEELSIKTNYEQMHLAKGKKIKYLQMKVNL